MRITNFCDQVYRYEQASSSQDPLELRTFFARAGDSLLSGWNCLLQKRPYVISLGLTSVDQRDHDGLDSGRVDTVWKVVTLIFPIFPIIGVIFKAIAMFSWENRILHRIKDNIEITSEEKAYVDKQGRDRAEYQSRGIRKARGDDLSCLRTCCDCFRDCCRPQGGGRICH